MDVPAAPAADAGVVGVVTVFSIGYGNRSMDELLELLDRRAIDYLLDVRSRPYSRFRPEFSKEALERGVSEAGLTYAWLGAQLGGIPEDPALRHEDGRLDAGRWVASAAFQAGLARLERAQHEGFRVCVMCAELRPEDCHRSRLIGRELLRRGLDMIHIDEEGRDVAQSGVEERVTRGQHDLFDAGRLEAATAEGAGGQAATDAAEDTDDSPTA